MKTSAKTLLLLFSLLLLSGCNKQKAEALKIAAEQFQINAITALDKVNELFLQNQSVAFELESAQTEQIVRDLNSLEGSHQITASLLDIWSSEAVIGQAQDEALNQRFDDLKGQYYTFEGLFSSLDKGSFVAKDLVKKAEKHAINLSMQLINFSKTLEAHDFKFTAQRVLIIEQMKKAKDEENEKLQKKLIEQVALEFVQLRQLEIQLKDDAIRECLKGAESGKQVAELIRNYHKMSLHDILSAVKTSMNYTLNITDGNKSVQDLIEKYETIETTIKEDPYWNILLKDSEN